MYPKLKEEDAMELRPNINPLLMKAQAPKPNLTREERLGLAQLKNDKDRVILTADKRVVMVVMDREDSNQHIGYYPGTPQTKSRKTI